MDTLSTPAREALRLNPDLVIPILEAFLRNEVKRTGVDKGIVGLSGGLDSSVVATLTVRALSAGRTRLIIMPHEVSSESSARDAEEVARVLGVEPVVIPITGMTSGYPDFPQLSNIRAGNLMARMRMAVLYDLSAEYDAMVIGTSNKTELLLGYGTLHGDMASAVNPVGDLYKTQLRQLASALNLPESIRNKIPSADLWAGQTDEDELGVEYETADEILYHLIDERLSVDEVVKAGFERELVCALWERIQRSEFKRHLPVICKLSRRTVGVDWLYPRDWGT